MTTNDIISLISKIRAKVNRHIESEMSRQGMEGIVTSHGDILYALFDRKRMTMAEIAGKIGRDKSTVTALVNKLESLGYVKKEKGTQDTRFIYVTLTQKGVELRPVFNKISGDILEKIYKDIPEKDKDELLKILEKIYSNL